MDNALGIFDSLINLSSRQEKAVLAVVESAVQLKLRPVASAILKVVRYSRWNEPVQIEKQIPSNPAVPRGPFRRNREGALLMYVPRDLEGRLIDDLSGGYGYSHLVVDCGETDEDTGKPVMVESTTGDCVHRRFLDLYGDRHFVRIPLSSLKLDQRQFCDCVTSKVGEPYDYLEALTWGEVDDPARQICSNLAADCLPDSIRMDIVQQHKEGRLSPTSISVHPRKNGELDVFVSPNAFCEYFHAPYGEDLTRPNQTFHPDRKRGISRAALELRGRRGWVYLALAGAVVSAWLLWQWRRQGARAR